LPIRILNIRRAEAVTMQAESASQTIFTPESFRDPYPFYRELRPQTPLLLHDDERQFYPLMKFRHVMDALKDPATFSSKTEMGGGMVLIGDDPPRHTKLRLLVNKVFTARRIAEAEPWISGIATELLDAIGSGETDVVDSYTMPLPVKVIATFLGIPPEDYRRFKAWSDAFIGEGADRDQMAVYEMFQYLGAMVTERRANPQSDLISLIAASEIDGESLSDSEVVGFILLLLIAGNETTTNLMSNMFAILADRPELWDRLRADRSLVEPVIEETLRFESPVQLLIRQATRDVEVGGCTIPAGSRVGVYFGAANRDPEEFDEPEEFRVDRRLDQHLAFGYGIHFCLGSQLARAEARITLNAFLDRHATLGRGTAPAERLHNSPIIFGYEALPLVLG
jgi:cytochrome P450